MNSSSPSPSPEPGPVPAVPSFPDFPFPLKDVSSPSATDAKLPPAADNAVGHCAPADACRLGRGSLSEEEARRLADSYKVLADPTRLILLSQMAVNGCGDQNVNDLTDYIGLSQPTVSHHLKKLEEAGLITKVRMGRNITCHLNPENFRHLQDFLNLS